MCVHLNVHPRFHLRSLCSPEFQASCAAGNRLLVYELNLNDKQWPVGRPVFFHYPQFLCIISQFIWRICTRHRWTLAENSKRWGCFFHTEGWSETERLVSQMHSWEVTEFVTLWLNSIFHLVAPRCVLLRLSCRIDLAAQPAQSWSRRRQDACCCYHCSATTYTLRISLNLPTCFSCTAQCFFQPNMIVINTHTHITKSDSDFSFLGAFKRND